MQLFKLQIPSSNDKRGIKHVKQCLLDDNIAELGITSLPKTSPLSCLKDMVPLFISSHLPAADLLPDSAMGNSEVTLITDISFLHHSQQCLEWWQYLLRPEAVDCRSHTHMACASWATKVKGSWESIFFLIQTEKMTEKWCHLMI